MDNFWDSNVWGFINVMAALLLSLLVANILRKSIKWLKDSLIPISVIGGALLVLIATGYKWMTGDVLFDTDLFAGKGTAYLELVTYHCLALGFIASSLKTSSVKMTKQRTGEIFNTGVTTVSTYLLQAVVGFGITIVAALIIPSFFRAAGVLLPFGYGQGTGQAMNYGSMYQQDYGFVGGKSFGLTIAAMGFISAALGGVFHLTVLKRRGKVKLNRSEDEKISMEDVQGKNEIPMQESVDKLTIQMALIAVSYMVAFLLMFGLGYLLPGMKSVIYGFNFLLGVLAATLVKLTFNLLRKVGAVKREYTNNFLLTRTSNFFFDLMVVAGVAAIRFGDIDKYWGLLLILGVSGLFVTFVYNRVIAKVLFPKYAEEQFLMMYGMLTGTASTGIILLREIDGEFKTPAADNMVYQNFPAIVFGFPLMLLATMAPSKPYLTLIILVAFFLVMNVILFRSKIFKRKKKSDK